MATARQLARLVGVVGTISSGAVRTYLGKTDTTQEGLGVVPKLMRFLSTSIATGSSVDEETARSIAAFLCRLVLRYGTVRRAVEAVAQGKRRHPAISADKVRGWSEVMSVTVGTVDPILRRHQWMRIQLSKWWTEQGAGLEGELVAFETWMDGPLPGSDDEHECPVLATAGSGVRAGASERTEEAGVAEGSGSADPLGGSELPEGVETAGCDNEDIQLLRAMLSATKRPAAVFGERVSSGEEWAALDHLRVSPEAYSRAVACVVDMELGAARACMKTLEGEESAGLATLRGDLLYAQGEYDRAVSLYRGALSQASPGAEQALCLVNLGVTLLRCQKGSSMDRAREARELLAGCVQGLEQGSRAWAIAQMQHGLAEMCPPLIDRSESIRAAISCLSGAVKALGSELGSGWWSEGMYWLGCAWMELTAGDRRENVERAIARFNDALSRVSRTETPGRWAAALVEMGIAWERMPTGSRGEALENAIGCFTSALSVRKKDRDPKGWARIQNNLGNLWVQFPGGNQRQNIERAIAHQQAALEVWSHEDRRMEWATTQSNLGNAWALLPAAEGEREKNLRRSIACYKSALEVRTRATHPLEWATTQNNLGSALLHLPTKGRAANVKEAILCYEQALEVRSRERFPLEWAKTQANLGNAWAKDPTGYKPDNLAEAVAYYQCALEVLTRERFPRQHKVISQRLGDAQTQLRER